MRVLEDVARIVGDVGDELDGDRRRDGQHAPAGGAPALGREAAARRSRAGHHHRRVRPEHRPCGAARRFVGVGDQE